MWVSDRRKQYDISRAQLLLPPEDVKSRARSARARLIGNIRSFAPLLQEAILFSRFQLEDATSAFILGVQQSLKRTSFFSSPSATTEHNAKANRPAR